MVKKIRDDIQRLKNPEKAKTLTGFFKTGKGKYAAVIPRTMLRYAMAI